MDITLMDLTSLVMIVLNWFHLLVKENNLI